MKAFLSHMEVEYDFVLIYRDPVNFRKLGDEVSSGVDDEMGNHHEFTGVAYVVATESTYAGLQRCYVKRYPPMCIEVSIELHPSFRKPRFDWGVKRGEYNDDTDEFDPDDRSGYMPEHDGKAWCDFWDFEKKEWRPDFPLFKSMQGVTSFLHPNPEVMPSNFMMGFNPLT